MTGKSPNTWDIDIKQGFETIYGQKESSFYLSIYLSIPIIYPSIYLSIVSTLTFPFNIVLEVLVNTIGNKRHTY